MKTTHHLPLLLTALASLLISAAPLRAQTIDTLPATFFANDSITIFLGATTPTVTPGYAQNSARGISVFW